MGRFFSNIKLRGFYGLLCGFALALHSLGCQQSAIDSDPVLGISAADVRILVDADPYQGASDAGVSLDANPPGLENGTGLEDAFTSSDGAFEPSDNGASLAQIGQTGDPCENSGDCESGFCVPAQGGKVCTEPCLDECPLEWACKLILIPGSDATFLCLPPVDILCRPCTIDEQCAPAGLQLAGYQCLSYGPQEGSFCSLDCEKDSDCEQEGFVCRQKDEPKEEGGAIGYCYPLEEQCSCSEFSVEDQAETSCEISNQFGTCTGARVCEADGLTECSAPAPEAELCDGQDNDCDGLVDEELEPAPCINTNDFGTCAGLTKCSEGMSQCDALVPALEACNAADDDCDGLTDEDMLDSDGDSVVDCVDPDIDGDGVTNEVDTCPENPNPGQEDLDGDGVGDACDQDLDGDGVGNEDDNCPISSNSDQTDVDADGVGDLCDEEILPDCDSACDCVTQGAKSAWFCESKLEGAKDTVWSCVEGLCSPVCGNLKSDPCDDDDDDDGVLDVDDNCPLTSNVEQADNDKDERGDVCDADDDNDGVDDPDDNCPFESNNAQIDTDEDLLGDACDGDDDGDGVPDDGDLSLNNDDKPCSEQELEGCDDNCRLVFNPAQSDVDGDGIGDLCDGDLDGDSLPDNEDNCPGVPNPDQADLDADSLGDLCDEDDDNDAVLDSADNCPFVQNSEQVDTDVDGDGDACDGDDDEDGVPDGSDNCVLIANTVQEDQDSDGLGDLCDPDKDGDFVFNEADNCPTAFNNNQGDIDSDGLGDACDEDMDGDGSVNDADCGIANDQVFPGAPELCNAVDDDCDELSDEDFADTDEDSVADCLDPDKDNDQILNGDDNCPLQQNTDQADIDGDGLGAPCDPDIDGDGSLNDDDCKPFNSAIYPENSESCNGGVDDDCDGFIDTENALGCTDMYRDLDKDSWGDEGAPARCLCAAEPITGYTVLKAGDCDDLSPAVNPEATERCNQIDDNCVDGVDEDFPSLGEACDGPDADSCAYGANVCSANGLSMICGAESEDNIIDICSGFDEDCDGEVDEGFEDKDFDGIADCVDSDLDGDTIPNDEDNCIDTPNENQSDYDEDKVGDVCDPDMDNDSILNLQDCEPLNEAIYPGADESCGNDADDDCDGLTDEQGALGCSQFHRDIDGDLFGAENATPRCLCAPDVANSYTATKAGDCDDYVGSTYPGAAEQCNQANDDCDDMIDESFVDLGKDCDGPDEDLCAYGTRICSADGVGTVCSIEVPMGIVEQCNGIDEDCDDFVDEDFPNFDSDSEADCIDVDDDNDGWSDAEDCAPFDASINPGVEEICGDNIDNDCNPVTVCLSIDWEGSEGKTNFVPIDTGQSGIDFYGYKSSSSNTGYEQDKTSLIALVRDNFGSVDVVIINSKPGGSEGGQLKLHIEGDNLAGYPIYTKLQDDLNSGNDDYEWNGETGEGDFFWKWSSCCNDGMVLGTLPTPTGFCMRPTWGPLSGIDKVRFISSDLSPLDFYPDDEGFVTGVEICTDL